MAVTSQKLQTGYKQTEIGVIPDDWTIKKCGEIGSFYKGKGVSSKDLALDGLPCIMYGDIYVKFDTKFSKPDFRISKNTADKSSLAKKWDLFFTGSGETAEEIGKCVVYMGNDDIYIGGDIIAWTPNPDNDSLFLAYTQNSKMLLSQKANLGQGYTVVHIYTEHIKSLKLPIPPTKFEQTAIATALYDIDTLIGKLESLIAKKRVIKQGAMQEFLTGKRRLPGFSGNWEKKKIGEFFLLSATYSKSKFIDDGGNYLIMDMGSISSSGQMIASKKTFLSADLLKTGDLVMPKDDIGGGNIIGKVAYIDQDNWYVLGDHVYKLSAKTLDADTLFFSYLINSNVVSRELKKKVSGSAQLGLGRKSVEEQDVAMPKEKIEQTAIAQVLNDMDVEILALEQKFAKYKMLKQGMVQVLLTGKVRLI